MRKGFLHKIRWRGAMVRSSLYVDDAAVFMGDIDNLSVILKGFGKVTDVCTNFHTSSVVPICCNHLNLENILQSLSETRTSFPLRYLGLPISVWQLKVDLQFDRILLNIIMSEVNLWITAGAKKLVTIILRE